MADLNVQPKKKQNVLPWILLALGLIALFIFMAKGCNTQKNENTTAVADSSSATTSTTTSSWDDVDFNSPSMAYGEITDSNINVRGNNNYSIYSLGENILFDSDDTHMRNNAEQNLKQIVASINKHHKGGEVRVYGYTDSQGSAGYNKELARQRGEVVESWIIKNGNIPKESISMHPVGEAKPVAPNTTAAGRQQNRRVEIVARGGQAAQ